MCRGRIEVIKQLWMAQDVGLQANKGFVLKPTKHIELYSILDDQIALGIYKGMFEI